MNRRDKKERIKREGGGKEEIETGEGKSQRQKAYKERACESPSGGWEGEWGEER